MCPRERQCVVGRDNVFSGETMCLRERQCVYWRDNVSTRETMCLPERQCVFLRDKVFSRERMCFLERQCVSWRDNMSSGDTMRLPDTGCPGQKLTSRWSPDLFPASIRITMMREVHWSYQKCPEHMKNHENQPPKFFLTKILNFFGKKYVDVKLKIIVFCAFTP